MALRARKRLQSSRQKGLPIPPRLEAVLLRLCSRSSPALSITQAVKLPYLVDVLAFQVLGRTITEGHHETWKYGVVTSEAWHFLRELPLGSPFELIPVPFSEEIRVEVTGESVEDQDLLTDDERRIVDFVAAEYAVVSPGELGKMTKRMNPSITSWGGNRPADTGGDAWERMTPEYLEMAESVAEVSMRDLRSRSRPVANPEDVLA